MHRYQQSSRRSRHRSGELCLLGALVVLVFPSCSNDSTNPVDLPGPSPDLETVAFEVLESAKVMFKRIDEDSSGGLYVIDGAARRSTPIDLLRFVPAPAISPGGNEFAYLAWGGSTAFDVHT